MSVTAARAQVAALRHMASTYPASRFRDHSGDVPAWLESKADALEQAAALLPPPADLDTLRHALAVATHDAEQIGEDGFPLTGSVERGYFLIEAVRAFLKS